MNMTLPLTDFLKSLQSLREEQALKTTLLGIGPMSERIVRLSLEVARSRDFPLLFIASRNQVDLNELGGGYVRAWDQHSFVQTIRELAKAIRFSGLCYLCRDHGGPWQRDSERRDKLPAERAMEIAKRSYLEDLVQGFDLLHIDPTKDPHAGSGSDLETVTRRTVALIEYIEKERTSRGLAEVCYEVGTEETSGGLTDPQVYGAFIRKLNTLLAARNLPVPSFIVGQTGTLVRLTENVGVFDAAAAEALSLVAQKHATGLKEHNADYLDDATLLQHPLLGITAANVAPEFGVVETSAYLQLGRVEEAARERGHLSASSHIREIIAGKTVAGQRWRKWMVGKEREMTVEEVENNDSMRMQIARICGHYVFDDAEVLDGLEQLRRNLAALGIDLDRYVDYRVLRSIDRYVTCFNLPNLTTKVLEHKLT
ncbi:MAG: class II D-tagatose-bisphosphate aldolase, non-catalytic subunit [Spirochaetaceae bacterium]|nr:MAG: class II D-tagatose-bisphosphate aldolase, non-catalytic subunit [Spirochaetaceae bacterium]